MRIRPVAAWLAAAFSLVFIGLPAQAQKSGGVLKVYHMDNPPGPSIHEEATVSVAVPFMGVFNNLVMYDQNKPQNSFETIMPDLATEWAWNEDGTKITFKLRQGVKWHDGKPFTAKDVVCTMDYLVGEKEPKLRRNPRQAWWGNVDKTVANSDYEVAIVLKAPQPSILALLSSGYTPIYPCHVPLAEMRRKPIGTGPFKFVEFQMNQYIKLVKNTEYWKPGRPYLDGIEYTIIQDRSTRILAFSTGKFDMTFPTDVTVPLHKDLMREAPHVQCTMRNTGVAINLIVNNDAPPFNDPRIKKALALTIDRKAFNDILAEGKASIGGAMLPPPDGVWGTPTDQLHNLFGYDNVDKQREQGRALMKEAGYGPDKRLKMKVSTRNIATFRDPAVILIDQLRHVFVDAELEVIDTGIYYNRVFKKDYTVALNLSGAAIDDPDQNLYENYACGSLRNYNNYCNPQMTKLFDEQSRQLDTAKRKLMVWDIDRKLQEEVARPIIQHTVAAGCWQPYVKGVTIHVNSIYNGARYEDVWLDK